MRVLPATDALTNELLLEVTLLVMDALLLSTSLKTLDKSMVESVASSLRETSAIGFKTVGGTLTIVKTKFRVILRPVRSMELILTL